MNPRLVVSLPDGGQDTVSLSIDPIIVGRDQAADLGIDHPSLSGMHALFDWQGLDLVVRDLGSANGIVVGGREVRVATISNGDGFRLGEIGFQFVVDAAVGPLVQTFKKDVELIKDELARRIIGQEEAIDQLLACLFASGHCLLVGVPGLAKTALVNTLAQVLNLSFRRVQFTPDLMPSDITGTTMISVDDGDKTMRFVPGPIFTQFLLADEINRTPPKTQAALLEAMQERQVTVGNETMPLPSPFVVVATQNPIEQEGTYPLPEAQQDRFMFNVYIDYPSLNEEEEILRRTTQRNQQPVSQVMNTDLIRMYQSLVKRVDISDVVIAYVAQLVRATRPDGADATALAKENLEWGAGPRAGQYLIWGGKALAAMDGRLAVSIGDVQRCAIPVLRHRISPNFQAQARGINADALIQSLVDQTPAPEADKFDS